MERRRKKGNQGRKKKGKGKKGKEEKNEEGGEKCTTPGFEPATFNSRGGRTGSREPDFADSALLLPLNLYGEKRRPFCWANKTCQALL